MNWQSSPKPSADEFASENEDQSLMMKNLFNEPNHESTDYKFKENDFNSKCFMQLNQFREDELFCDLEIKVENQIIKAHKVILTTAIPYFYHMFSSNLIENQRNEVEIKEISYSIMIQIIDYAYSGEITLNTNNVQEICIASSFLCIKSVLNASIDYIIEHLNHSNVLEYKSFNDLYSFPILESHIEEFINEEFAHIYKTNEFLELSFDEIKKIISNNELNVEEERIVYEAMIRWIKSDENRKNYLCPLLEEIRLPFISSEYIVDHIVSEDLIKQCLKCRDLIDEAKDYHLLPQRRNLIQNQRTIKRSFTKERPIIAIGSSEGKTTYFEIFDTILDKWKIYLIENRQLKLRTSITVLKNSIVFIGGYENGIRTDNVEMFNLIDKKWSQIARLNKKRSALASVTLDNSTIYAMGGYDGTKTLNCCECYLPNVNKWVYIAEMNKFRCSSTAVVCNGQVYVIGGHNGLTIFKSIERYDPIDCKWTLCKDMSKERCRLGSCSLNGKIYCAGGFSGKDDESSFECYDPATDEWTELEPMLRQRSRFSLIASGKNKIYAIGGYIQNNFSSSCEVYDLEKNKWTFVSPMNAKQNPTGTIMMNFKY